MLIADTTAALIVMPPGIGVLVRDTANVKNLRANFEEIWEESLPFGRPALPPQQEKVLDLLIQGRELGAIATDLGISRDAVHKHARELRRKLGASTMAQAGVLSALRGWGD